MVFFSKSGMEVVPDMPGKEIARDPNSEKELSTTSSSKTTAGAWKYRHTTLWLTALLLVVIAAAIGGGVGGAHAMRRNRKDCRDKASNETSPTSVTRALDGPEITIVQTPDPTLAPNSPTEDFQGSSFISVTPDTITWGPYPSVVPIPPKNDFNYTSRGTGNVFTVHFLRNIFSHTTAYLLTPTFEACVEACANANHLLNGDDHCLAAVWNAAQTAGGTTLHGVKYAINCYLHNVGTPLDSDDRGGAKWVAVKQYPIVSNRTKDNCD